MTPGDILVLAVLGLIVGGILAGMVRKKQQGKPSCCGSCSGCTGCSGCKFTMNN